MAKLPKGRKPLPNEWFVDKANLLEGKDIREMDEEERQRAKEKEKKNQK